MARFLGFEFLDFAFCLESIVDRLIGVYNEGNDDIYEDQICKLDECGKVGNDKSVFILVEYKFIHIYDAFPVILPHY